jgi:hypothetical protein
MESRQSESGKVSSGERKVEGWTFGQSPRTMSAPGRLGRESAGDAPAHEFGKAPTPVLPLLPHQTA